MIIEGGWFFLFIQINYFYFRKNTHRSICSFLSSVSTTTFWSWCNMHLVNYIKKMFYHCNLAIALYSTILSVFLNKNKSNHVILNQRISRESHSKIKWENFQQICFSITKYFSQLMCWADVNMYIVQCCTNIGKAHI